MKKHTIWSSLVDINDWSDYFEENGIEPNYADIYNLNGEYLDDERVNLDIKLNNPIIVIGKFGLWDGIEYGYKIIDSGNIKDTLYSECDEIEWYVDRYNMEANGYHHDGTNHYIYRELKPNTTIRQIKSIVRNDSIDRKALSRYTKSLKPYIAKVYGW